MEITPILPPSNNKIDFDLLDCSAFGPEVSIVDDFELQVQSISVIELIGSDSKILFYTDCGRPYLVVQFKSIERFLKLSVLCSDDTGNDKLFEMSNKSSFITIDKNMCKMPLEIDIGWQYVCIELEELLANAFGTSFVSCKEVTVSGSCRLARLYFQSKKYSDVELPSFLRVVASE
jgi:hypothetical protein